MQNESSSSRPPRLMLYSHDSVGLGHLRRTLTLATELNRVLPEASLLLASGSEASLRFALPDGLEVVKLPSVGKGEDGGYLSRRLPCGLPTLIRIRRALLLQLVLSYRPDILIVDHKVLGVADELEPVLRRLRAQGGRAVLGVRDVIDTPEVVALEWGRERVRWALEHSYDAVCVYGSRELYDMQEQYPVPPELSRRLRFTGYVVREARGPAFRATPRLRPQVIVTMGGGEDGAERIEAYLAALELEPPAWDSVIVLGPLLDSTRTRHLKRRARAMQGVEVHSFYEDMPRLLASSSAVVSMAGYNSVAEIVRARIPAVLLPRTKPRLEQLLRARAVARLGYADYLVDPEPALLRLAVERALARGRTNLPLPPFDGAQQFARIVCEMLGRRVEGEAQTVGSEVGAADDRACGAAGTIRT